MADKTKLLYPEDFLVLTAEARVEEVAEENGKTAVVLDTTIFYPQGGGQPYDTGVIEGESGTARFIVEETRFADGVVKHIGHFERGIFAAGDEVKLSVDAPRRALHSRLHSAGHIVDMAVVALGLAWIPGKGFHFPQGPYVEYGGSLDGLDKEKIKIDLQVLCKKFIAENIATKIAFPTPEEMARIMARNPAATVPDGKSPRVVMFGDFAVSPPRRNPGKFLTLARSAAAERLAKFPDESYRFIPCGGTHVRATGEINTITIRKIKAEGANIRVGYDVL